jgi:thermostable 8-oxoguanine DNA glycosylase
MQKLFGTTEYHPISLGYSCYPAMFITKVGVADLTFYERHVFDWLGTSMWSICKLIENDFADFISSKDVLVNRKHNIDSDTFHITNSENNVIFSHDFNYLENVTENDVNKVREKYDRRIERFKQMLVSDKKIVFIRLERWNSNFINFPEYNITESETFYVKKFSSLLKEKGTNFKILYLTTTNPTAWDPESQICYVNFTPPSGDKHISEFKIRDILLENKEFIHASFKDT